MTQQINLLPVRQARLGGGAIWASVAALMLVAGVFYYRHSMVLQNDAAEEAVASLEAQVIRMRGAMMALQKQRPVQDDGAAIKAEIAALRPSTDAANQLLNEVRSGSLGSIAGYARHFSMLGSISPEGLWLTGITVDRGGAGVILTGGAVRTDAVMQYARRVNDAFGSMGIRFSALEFAADNSSSRPASAPAAGAVAFKLSSTP